MTKDEIRDTLDAAGISYDARLSKANLAALLPVDTTARAVVAPPRKQAQSVACMVLRDFWDKDGVRTRKNTIIDLDPMEAIDAIEAGMVRRVR